MGHLWILIGCRSICGLVGILMSLPDYNNTKDASPGHMLGRRTSYVYGFQWNSTARMESMHKPSMRGWRGAGALAWYQEQIKADGMPWTFYCGAYSPFIKGGSEYPGGPPIEPDEPEEITITGVELIVPGPDPKQPNIDSKSIPLPMELFTDAWKAEMGIEIMESKYE